MSIWNSLSTGTAKTIQIAALAVKTLAILLVASLTIYIINGYMSLNIAVNAYVCGKEVGTVADVSVMRDAVLRLETDLENSLGECYKFKGDITYKIKLTEQNITPLNINDCYSILNAICSDGFRDAYSLYIDDIYVASGTCEASIREAISLVEEKKTAESRLKNESIVSETITNTITILPDSVSGRRILSTEIIYDIITENDGLFEKSDSLNQDIRTISTYAANDYDFPDITQYLTENNDDFSDFVYSTPSLFSASVYITDDLDEPDSFDDNTITNKNAICADYSALSNPQLDYGVCRIPEGFSYIKPSGIADKLNFKTVTLERFSEVIPYETVYIESPFYYNDVVFLSAEGSNGVFENVYEKITCNGEIIERNLVAENIIIEMHPEVYTYGSKTPPPAEPTGVFLWPLQTDFRISSYYGEKRAEFDGDAFHYGVDLAGCLGDFVYASDGGVVIFAERISSYGNLIIIEHNNSYKTYYAHLNEILVSVDDAVYQGKIIGTMGSTGVSTAPHLHFEIRKELMTLNPLGFLPER